MVARVVIYCRVSTDMQEEKGTSLEDQETRLRRRAANEGWAIVGVHRDVMSGAAPARPGFDAALKAIRDGTADILLVTHTSRLSRLFSGFPALLDDLARWGDRGGIGPAHIVSTDDSIDTRSTGAALMGAIGSAFAAAERATTRERTVRGRLNAAREGRWPTSTAPFGWKRVRREGGRGWELAPNDQEAAVLRRMVELVTKHQLTYEETSRQLNAEGALRRGSKPWNTTLVRSWIGKISHIEAAEGRFSYEGIALEYGPAILTPAETAAWRAHLIKRAQGQGRPKRDYLLSGYIYFACGRRGHGRTQPHRANRPEQTSTYTCRSHMLSKTDPDRHHDCLHVPVAIADGAVLNVLKGWMIEHMDVLVSGDSAGVTQEARDQAKARIQEARRKYLNHLAGLQTLELSREDYEIASRGPLQDELNAAQRAYDLLESQRFRQSWDPTLLATRIAEQFDSPSTETWRDLFSAIDLTVTIQRSFDCPKCDGGGYGPVPEGRGRGWPPRCSDCLGFGRLPDLLIEFDELVAGRISDSVKNIRRTA